MRRVLVLWCALYGSACVLGGIAWAGPEKKDRPKDQKCPIVCDRDKNGKQVNCQPVCR